MSRTRPYNRVPATLPRRKRRINTHKRKVTTGTVKKIVTNLKPTKFYLSKVEEVDVTNTSLNPILFPSQVLYTSTEADAHYKREGYKIRAMNAYVKGEILVGNSATRVTKLRILLVKGYRAGALTTADIALTQPLFAYSDQYLMFINPKNCKVLWDKTFTLQNSTAATPGVSQSIASFTKNFRLNETWRYPSADPAFNPDPINPGSYQFVVISNQTAGNGPKVDLNMRVSFKDM